MCIEVFLTNNQVAMGTITPSNQYLLFPVGLFLVPMSGKTQHIFFSSYMCIFLPHAHIKQSFNGFLLRHMSLFAMIQNVLLRSLQSDLKDQTSFKSLKSRIHGLAEAF